MRTLLLGEISVFEVSLYILAGLLTVILITSGIRFLHAKNVERKSLHKVETILTKKEADG